MPRLGRRHLERGCFHVLNRGNHRQTLFHGPDEYAQFLDLLAGAQKRFQVGLWGYCLMSNHWHLNPVRARLVGRGRDWPWSSLSRAAIQRELLPVERPRLQPWLRNAAWEEEVDQPMQASPLAALRQSVVRGTPFGAPDWVGHLVAEQGLETTVRPRGRPRKLASAS